MLVQARLGCSQRDSRPDVLLLIAVHESSDQGGSQPPEMERVSDDRLIQRRPKSWHPAFGLTPRVY